MQALNTNLRLMTIDGGSIRGNVIPPTLINAYSALTVPAYYRAVRLLSEQLASFPRSVRRDGARPAADEPPHPLTRLLKRSPNPLSNPFTFWRTWFLHTVHQGNGFVAVRRGPDLAPAALEAWLPENVVIGQFDRGDGAGLQRWYYDSASKDILPAADVLHLVGFGWDGVVGLDPVGLHSATLNRAATLGKYLMRYLTKGSMIRGSIQIPGALTDEQLATFRARVRESFQGPDGEDDVIFLTEGATLNNAAITPQDGQIMQQAAHTTKAIAQLTGVPPEMLFELGEAKYNASAEQAGQNLVRYCLRPYIEQAEAELTMKLLSEADQDAGLSVHINPDALLRGSTKEQEDIANASVAAGTRTKNEARAGILGLPPVADGEADKLKTLGDTAPSTDVN